MGRPAGRRPVEERRRRERGGDGDRTDAGTRGPARSHHLRHPLVRWQTPWRRQVPPRAGRGAGVFGGYGVTIEDSLGTCNQSLVVDPLACINFMVDNAFGWRLIWLMR